MQERIASKLQSRSRLHRGLLALCAGLATLGCSTSPQASERPKGPLALQLEAIAAQARSKLLPGDLSLVQRASQELEASGITNAALQVGDTAPHFQLPDTQGHAVSLDSLLQAGPVVLTFYRGHW